MEKWDKEKDCTILHNGLVEMSGFCMNGELLSNKTKSKQKGKNERLTC